MDRVEMLARWLHDQFLDYARATGLPPKTTVAEWEKLAEWNRLGYRHVAEQLIVRQIDSLPDVTVESRP